IVRYSLIRDPVYITKLRNHYSISEVPIQMPVSTRVQISPMPSLKTEVPTFDVSSPDRQGLEHVVSSQDSVNRLNYGGGAAMSDAEAPVEVFCSYTSEDEVHLLELMAHLSGLQREGRISIWYDRQIIAGGNRAEAIDTHLETASLILLLVSADFL